MADLVKLKEIMIDLKEEEVYELLTELMSAGGSDAQAALETCQEAMTEIGNRFETGVYFLGDLLYSSEIMSAAVDILKPALSAGSTVKLGKLVICTVKGDIHDIGKNIVKGMLEAAGFDVIDLGIDVLPEKIVATAAAEDVKIVALSGVLTLALRSMQDVVDAFVAAGTRNDVKIIIGGNPVTVDACAVIGADEWANSPQKGVEVCRVWATS
ncbi:MAG: cobalamin-dependent protein [Coriobacteriales bacterium]|jgi:methylmalonyl-CoA mutase cobalamin-binding domain/chain|nr:cobalamin-dependent protein [Coriobacteriales bacterium]